MNIFGQGIAENSLMNETKNFGTLLSLNIKLTKRKLKLNTKQNYKQKTLLKFYRLKDPYKCGDGKKQYFAIFFSIII